MNRKKRSAFSIFTAAAVVSMLAAGNAAVFRPINASASAVFDEQIMYTSSSAEYPFLTRGNPASTRERISAEYGELFVEVYDKIQEKLTDLTLNSTETTDRFTVSFDLSKYKIQVSDDPDTPVEVITQLKNFAQNVLEDSPQFYWTTNRNAVYYEYSMTRTYYYNINFNFLIDPKFETPEARAEANKKMNDAVEAFSNVLSGKRTVYSKLKAVNDKLVLDTYYDIKNGVSNTADHSQNVYGCLVNHRCVCNGYAKAFELVCNRFGITDTVRITGKLVDAFKGTKVDHAWNACLVGGKWYFVDVTANDPLRDTTGSNEYNDPDKYDKYFLIGSRQLASDHDIEVNAVPYPHFETSDFTEPTLATITQNGKTYCAISDADDLVKYAGMVDYYDDCPNALLTEDIDLSGRDFVPIGNKDHPFKGIFNGAGHSIKGIAVNSGSSPAGLFGVAEKATITDVTLLSGSVNGSATDEEIACGALAGSVTTDTVITNCVNAGVTVKGKTAGGIVGSVTDGVYSAAVGKIKGCTNNAAVNGSKYGGGIVGIVKASAPAVIENCISRGNVTSDKAASFVGKAASDVNISGSLSLVPYEVYGEKGSSVITADKVCVIGFVSSVDGVSFAENTTDGAAAYALGWGQVLGKDNMPDPSRTSPESKVRRLEYTVNSKKSAVYFNGAFDSSMLSSVVLPEGNVWKYKGKTIDISELDGLAADISLSAEELDAYISDRAFMTLGESMSYCWLVGADEDIIKAVKDGKTPVKFTAKVNGENAAVHMNGIKSDSGKDYIEFSVDIPAKNLADKISCEISYESEGSTLTYKSNERSAADYLRKLAVDSSLSDEVRATAVSILNYSTAVQRYKGYNTDNPANEGIAPALKEIAPVSAGDINAEGSVLENVSDEMSLKAVTVNMLSRVTLRAYYKLGANAAAAYNNDMLTFDYTAPDGTGGSRNVGLSAESSGICGREGEFIWVELPEGISPKDYANRAEISLSNGADKGDSIKYSVLNYIAGKCETTFGMEKVAAAMYRYYEAVKALAG